MPRGGKRQGAGKPPLPDGEKTKPVSYRFSAKVRAILEALPNGSKTRFIEDAIISASEKT